MKKSMKIFSVLMGLALVLTLGGCRLWDEIQDSVGPTNKWVKFNYQYQAENMNVNIHCYMIYSDGTYKNDEIKDDLPETTVSGGKFVKGLTVVLAPNLESGSSDADFATLFGVAATDKRYVLKTFADGSDVELDGATSPFKMGYTTWAVIYSSVQMTQCGLPVALNEDANYTAITDLKSFQWKKLLAQMAFAKLTPYLEN